MRRLTENWEARRSKCGTIELIQDFIIAQISLLAIDKTRRPRHQDLILRTYVKRSRTEGR
jgi:putative N-acetylmannosamine-6-phosphate epimerase